jgi:hypothetical protein
LLGFDSVDFIVQFIRYGRNLLAHGRRQSSSRQSPPMLGAAGEFDQAFDNCGVHGSSSHFVAGSRPTRLQMFKDIAKSLAHEPPTATNRPIETLSPSAMNDRSSAFRGNGTEREKFSKNVAINVAESSKADTQNIRRADCFAKPSS